MGSLDHWCLNSNKFNLKIFNGKKNNTEFY